MSENTEFETLRQQRLAEQINQIQTEMNTVADTETARMPERVFVNVFLPLFAGETELVYPSQATLLNWGRIAGSPYKSIHVIDGKGAILFTVPPLYDRTAVNPVRGRGPSLAHIAQTAEQYGAQSPVQGQQYLNAKLTERALIMKVPVNVLAHIETWNMIFAKYGRPPIMDLEPADKAAEPDNKPGDFEYEFNSDD